MGAAAADLASLVSVPGASSIGAVATSVLDGLKKKRIERAREIMIAELKAGHVTLDSSNVQELEESVAILQRYLRAAEEGAARPNLRLLAAVFAGQIHERSFAADDFLYFADMLASLRRDEVILLATILRTSARHPDKPGADSSTRLAANTVARSELVPRIFEDNDHFNAVGNSLQRTGLILATSVSITSPAPQCSTNRR